MSIDFDFKTNPAFGPTLFDWWKGLDTVEASRPSGSDEAPPADGEAETDAPRKRGDRAGRALLRHAHSLTAVVMTPAYQRLFRHLCAQGWPARSDWRNDRLAAVAGLLAHVTDDDDRPLPLAMSRRRRGVSE